MNFQNLQNIYYINLEERIDRKKHIENEFKKLGWNNYTRFNAIKHSNGAIGCSMSHLEILKNARNNNLDYVVILEDDIQFLDIELYKKLFNKYMNNNIEFDVFMLAGNLIGNNKKNIRNDYYIKINKCYTTTGYIVKKHYYDKLINNIEEGINNLVKEYKKNLYAIDVYWGVLQRNDNWYILYPRTISQLPCYSDIEKRYVNYKIMVDIL